MFVCYYVFFGECLYEFEQDFVVFGQLFILCVGFVVDVLLDFVIYFLIVGFWLYEEIGNDWIYQ